MIQVLLQAPSCAGRSGQSHVRIQEQDVSIAAKMGYQDICEHLAEAGGFGIPSSVLLVDVVDDAEESRWDADDDVLEESLTKELSNAVEKKDFSNIIQILGKSPSILILLHAASNPTKC